MTRSTNMEHVAHLQRMANESWIGSPERAALDAAIASLKALEYVFGLYTDWGLVVEEKLTPPWPLEHHARAMGLLKDKPPAEAQAVEWQVRLVNKSNGAVFRDWTNIDQQRYEAEKGGSEGDTLRCEYRELYAAPPSAPVGVVDVDALAQEIRRVDGAHSLGASALAEALVPYLARTTLTQQPAAVDEGARLDAERMDAIKRLRLAVTPVEGGGWDVSVFGAEDCKETLLGSGADVRSAIDEAVTLAAQQGGRSDD